MLLKRKWFLCLMAISVGSGLFAGGSKDSVDKQTSSDESWLETIDIKDKKPGKYNILVTAEDLAGNKGLAGPYNMYIDPNSDLPVTGITNPLGNMRVPGNLNIVGTCVDDDAVDHVELVLDNSDTPVRAEGKNFWSYYLDTRGLTEGPHKIAAYGIDINGVKGKPSVVVWNLDRNQPETSVENHAMGSLVSGKFSLSGKVTDGNGIKALSYSLNNGSNWTPIDLKHNKKTSGWTFDLSLNSLKMKDGPAVCWFKATDGQGTDGIYTFLYFVDNTKPEVHFIAPAAGESVNGIFSVAGSARDTIGIASLSWKSGKQTGTFDLVKGNPYWIKEFDVRDSKDKNFEVEITAVDTAGNKTTVVRKIPINHAADIPTLTVTSPSANAVVDGNLELSGMAVDDDSIAEVWYSIDKGKSDKIDSRGAFSLTVAGLSPGKHQIEVWPVDENLVAGARKIVPFTVKGAVPSIAITPPGGDYTGINPESGASISASVTSPAGLKSLSWAVTGRADVTVPVKTGATSASVKVPIAADFPYGELALEIRAVDVYDRETKQKLNFYVTNLGIPRGTVPSFSDDTLKSTGEVTIAASGKTPASTGQASVAIEQVLPADQPFANGMNIALAGPGAAKAAQKDGSIRIGIDSPIPVAGVTWSLNGGAPGKASAQKTGATRYEANIPLKALLPADWTKLEATVSFKDQTTQTVSGVFCVVRPAPSGGIHDDAQFSWDQTSRDGSDSILLFDGAAASGLFNGKPGRHAASVAFLKPVDGLAASLSGNAVTVSGTKDGEYRDLKLIITDNEGDTFRTEAFSFIVDSALPELSVDTTERPTWIQTQLPVRGTASSARGIAKTEYSFDGGANWTAFVGAGTAFNQKLDVSALPDGKIELLVRTTDKSGRTKSDWRVFNKDTTPPSVEVVLPEPGDGVNGQTAIAFKYADASPLVFAEYRAPGDRTAKDKTQWLPLTVSSMTNTLVGTADQPISDKMEFRFTDAAGNAFSIDSWQFKIDAEADKPVVEIHVPAEDEVIRKDFMLSGVVYDDDQPAKVWYKIDDGKYTELPIEHSFSIPIPLSSLTDNEHTISVYAEDIYGVRGDEVTRKIRVSLEEPKAEVRAPSFDKTNTGPLDITGVSSDKNGIDKVEVSLDNGNTYNLASGTESWSYHFDTRVIEDGTHVVFVKVYDKYGTTGLYSSLINIDNTAPSIKLELPMDGSRTGQTLFVSGQTMDNIGLDRVSAKISNIEPKQPAIPASLSEISFANELIISRGIDIGALPEGFYNLEVRGFDRAGNVTRVSRNFEVYRGKERNRIEFLYPLNGEKAQGIFNLYGRVVSEDPVKSLILYVDGKDVGSSELSSSGYFKFTVTPEMIADGTHQLAVRALASEDKVISSEEHSIIYKSDGPWVTIDNLAMGDFAIDRPWLKGSAGYSLTEDEVVALKTKQTPKDVRRTIGMKSLAKVEISFDNGKSFVKTETGKKWRFRIETGDIAEGYHFLIVRATMQNGEVAVSRSIVQIDKTAPVVKLISPGEGGRYNNDLVFSGLSSDDVKLKGVKLSLRAGDKSAYAVPSFIQGLYFDWHFWGATLYDVGVGLTFFGDNVKIQGQFGQFTESQRAMFTKAPMRYGGNVYGIKMLANVAYVPMDYFFGPNFSWLSATAAVGANFSMFSETQSGKAQILSAMLMQIEFPRMTIPKRTTFRTFSFYTEGQLWFIPTDVNSSEVNINSIVPHITGGVRLNVF
jgi:hypothetical protein